MWNELNFLFLWSMSIVHASYRVSFLFPWRLLMSQRSIWGKINSPERIKVSKHTDPEFNEELMQTLYLLSLSFVNGLSQHEESHYGLSLSHYRLSLHLPNNSKKTPKQRHSRYLVTTNICRRGPSCTANENIIWQIIQCYKSLSNHACLVTAVSLATKTKNKATRKSMF